MLRYDCVVCCVCVVRKKHTKKAEQMSEMRLKFESQKSDRWTALQTRVNCVKARRAERLCEMQRRRDLLAAVNITAATTTAGTPAAVPAEALLIEEYIKSNPLQTPSSSSKHKQNRDKDKDKDKQNSKQKHKEDAEAQRKSQAEESQLLDSLILCNQRATGGPVAAAAGGVIGSVVGDTSSGSTLQSLAALLPYHLSLRGESLPPPAAYGAATADVTSTGGGEGGGVLRPSPAPASLESRRAKALSAPRESVTQLLRTCVRDDDDDDDALVGEGDDAGTAAVRRMFEVLAVAHVQCAADAAKIFIETSKSKKSKKAKNKNNSKMAATLTTAATAATVTQDDPVLHRSSSSPLSPKAIVDNFVNYFDKFKVVCLSFDFTNAASTRKFITAGGVGLCRLLLDQELALCRMDTLAGWTRALAASGSDSGSAGVGGSGGLHLVADVLVKCAHVSVGRRALRQTGTDVVVLDLMRFLLTSLTGWADTEPLQVLRKSQIGKMDKKKEAAAGKKGADTPGRKKSGGGSSSSSGSGGGGLSLSSSSLAAAANSADIVVDWPIEFSLLLNLLSVCYSLFDSSHFKSETPAGADANCAPATVNHFHVLVVSTCAYMCDLNLLGLLSDMLKRLLIIASVCTSDRFLFDLIRAHVLLCGAYIDTLT